jgi:hypothetical protein
VSETEAATFNKRDLGLKTAEDLQEFEEYLEKASVVFVLGHL